MADMSSYTNLYSSPILFEKLGGESKNQIIELLKTQLYPIFTIIILIFYSKYFGKYITILTGFVICALTSVFPVFSPTNLKGRLIQRYKDYNKGGIKTYRNHGNINLLKNKMLRNEPIYNGNDCSGNSYILKNKSNIFPKEKHYHPQRYDYKGSRYGDYIYNYYLNSPMRGDISEDWRFPPIYYYNPNKSIRKK